MHYKENSNSKAQNKPKKLVKPKLKEKLNKLFFWLLIGLFCLFSVGSIFGILAFSNDGFKVHADEVTDFYSFDGSDVYMPTWFFGLETLENVEVRYRDGSTEIVSGLNVVEYTGSNGIMCNFAFKMEDTVYNGEVYTELVISTLELYGNSNNLATLSDKFAVLNNPLTKYNTGQNSSVYDVNFVLPRTTDYFYIPYTYLSNPTQMSVCRALLRCYKSSVDFNCDIVKIEIGGFIGSTNFFNTVNENNRVVPYQKALNYNFIRYYDRNNNFIEFAVPCGSSNVNLLDNRTYYLSTDLDNQTVYNQGVYDGIQQGKQEGIQIGRQEAVNEYKDVWYQDGYNNGIEDSNQYTFLSVISAMVDAPIQALSGLLSFDLLGFNMFGLFGGLFTLAIIIFIIRLIL